MNIEEDALNQQTTSITIYHSGSYIAMDRVIPYVCTALLAARLMVYWLHKTNAILPDPYLDEVFHVRQAQAYWDHRWQQWDPKITTPPGLYLVSYAVASFSATLFGRPVELSASVLRCINGLVLFNVLQLTLRRFFSIRQKQILKKGDISVSTWSISLSALNICLFPPVFFFSGLYYTDLAALIIVLETCNVDFPRSPSANGYGAVKGSLRMTLRYLSLIILGLAALVFRQTNIFWVSVFLGGLQVANTLRSRSVECQSSDIQRIAKGSWELNQLYDPPVAEAYIEDYFKVGFSLAISALANLFPVLVALLPYLFLLGCFGLFVIINGSVVLGHKEFHSAGLHLPQMLYIWPYFMFFSWPIILYPWALGLWNYIGQSNPKNLSQLTSRLPRLGIMLSVLVLMIPVVHLNTIVHPFTLADNRHYVFYVFRLLLRYPMVKYAVIPIYLLCGWTTIAAFNTSSTSISTDQIISTTSDDKGSKESNKAQSQSFFSTEISTRTSFVLIWLIATSLSLITAPLVEPRYFIIPWVIWRLHITPLSRKNKDTPESEATVRSPILEFTPLLTETAWYLLINLVTGYMFLYKGFEWPQEPGKVQRFMW
ncbi:hypothetical protein MGYG_03017 [Nannizzia gypsea CBS 118893]|uniref:Dol-P-Glc:Glc(2)Man(9)GlcNAc(2)-PP-Dol alpha-1,2-glucosyltransferase n=1 Tax=Arthroderma gypseum (strain ATCC MYA-4604 / CBS 118893) TaxID=535722 RepID=E4UQE0_ARTGP|nr:hypothetical protein MGYG_03017 [Nannizzia gypsea CBS 118893]EFR00010.1 hypothetical protein MGYG_03017 [Nannizzia gypsea CBS 118893]